MTSIYIAEHALHSSAREASGEHFSQFRQNLKTPSSLPYEAFDGMPGWLTLFGDEYARGRRI